MARSRSPEARAALLLWLAGALAGAAPARALDVAGGGAIRLTVSPQLIVLGNDSEAELRIAAPPGVEQVEVTASAGKVEDLRRGADGVFLARYRPPVQRTPQVAILTAVSRSGTEIASDGWLALPLSGRADLRVKTRPGAQIALRVGDHTFGPSRAGPDGIARISIVVPPGVREAHHGFRPIDLQVPDTTLVRAVADRTSVRADLHADVRVLAYVVAPHGAARRGDVPVFDATRGSVTVHPREPGAFEAHWRIPPGSAGEQRLVVRLPGSAASREVVRVEALAGPPATVAVAFDRDALVAGPESAIGVTARVLDGAGNPTPGNVLLEADVGEVGGPTQRGPGVYEARWRIPAAIGERSEAVLTARVPESAIAGSRALPLRAAAPAVARFEAGADVVVADTGREAALRLTVVDRYENPVPRLAPAVTASRGRVLGVSAERPGVYLVRYEPPPVRRRTDERIEVDLGGVRARADLVLVPVRSGVAFSPSAGFAADVRGRASGAWLGLAAERRASRLPAWAALRLETGWAALRDRDVGASADVIEALVGASARREAPGRAALVASAAAGLTAVRADGGWGAAPAARVAAGVAVRRGWGIPFLEVGLLASGSAGDRLGAFAALTAAVGVRLDTDWLAPARDADAARRRDGDASDRR